MFAQIEKSAVRVTNNDTRKALSAYVESRKVLLVCSGICNEVENCLQQAGCQVTKVDQSAAAVNRARHEALDAAVLVSTGPEMDVAETALNLRDVNPSIAIIFVAGRQGCDEEAGLTDAIAHAIPKAKVLTTIELGHYFESPEWSVH